MPAAESYFGHLVELSPWLCEKKKTPRWTSPHQQPSRLRLFLWLPDRCCTGAQKKQRPWRMFEDLSFGLPNDRTNQAGCYHLGETNSWEGYRSLARPQLNPIQYLVGLTFRQPHFFFFFINRRGWIDAQRKCLEAKTLQLWQKLFPRKTSTPQHHNHKWHRSELFPSVSSLHITPVHSEPFFCPISTS